MVNRADFDSTFEGRNLTAGDLEHNAYITDGHGLFRCLESSDGKDVMLEDCLTLELTLCQVGELVRAEARLVKPGNVLAADIERPLPLAVAP